MAINKVIISGNLTRDPELYTTQSGTSILKIGVAVNDRVKNNQTGEWEDRPNYVDCTIFGNRATSLQNILAKGMRVCIEGRLHWSQWEKDGQKRSKLDVNVSEVVLMQNSGQAPQAQRVQPQTQPAQPYAQPQSTQVPAQLYDADIPF
ncbi:MAG: single-stranded DNA-binding protein [Eggerthellaceae bacterium]|jgi:single-strand DNA-binding protein|nr:single-stranded DNA-binding protein [Eggerthellaceae bacterium]MCH4220469.1 single-stranded DNA-binding protein [Eggerthellaceae bacterium]